MEKIVTFSEFIAESAKKPEPKKAPSTPSEIKKRHKEAMEKKEKEARKKGFGSGKRKLLPKQAPRRLG